MTTKSSKSSEVGPATTPGADPHLDLGDAPLVPGKKPYETPQLVVYGDLRELTSAQGFQGVADGGTVLLMRKTH